MCEEEFEGHGVRGPRVQSYLFLFWLELLPPCWPDFWGG